MSQQINFCLPLGIEKDGKLLKHGKMHLTTTMDELKVQTSEDTELNPRYRDILLLASVIDEIEDITDVDKDVILDLYEADFLYLQLLYNQVNGTSEPITTKCQNCGYEFPIMLSELYSDKQGQ